MAASLLRDVEMALPTSPFGKRRHYRYDVIRQRFCRNVNCTHVVVMVLVFCVLIMNRFLLTSLESMESFSMKPVPVSSIRRVHEFQRICAVGTISSHERHRIENFVPPDAFGRTSLGHINVGFTEFLQWICRVLHFNPSPPLPEQVNFEFGYEFWSKEHLNMVDTSKDFEFMSHGDGLNVAIPDLRTVLLYGKRGERGRSLFGHLQSPLNDAISISLDDLREDLALAKLVGDNLYKNAAGKTGAELAEQWDRPYHGLLAALNSWVAMQRFVQDPDHDLMLILEDDVVVVPDFVSRLKEVIHDLDAVAVESDKPWDVAFVGTCLGITETPLPGTRIAPFPGTRCFNGVLMSKRCAEKVLRYPAQRDEFLSVDLLFNHIIEELDLASFLVQPPLAMETSKMKNGLSCTS